VDFVQLRFAFKKLSIAVDHVRALGVDHIIGGEIKIVKDRIRRIITWPVPTCQTDVRNFLGSVSITRRWAKNYGKIARPLNRLTGKVDWRWTDAE
jgi:hypothetical protein